MTCMCIYVYVVLLCVDCCNALRVNSVQSNVSKF